MKTKKITCCIAVMVFTIMIFSEPAISRQVAANLTGSILRSSTLKCMPGTPRHFSTFPGWDGADRPFLKRSAESDNYHADTVFSYSINSGNKKTTYAYDNQHNLLTTLEQMWVINKWVNSTLATNTYDGTGNMLTETAQLWQNGVWVNGYQMTHSYDGAGNCLNTVGKEWDGTAWMNMDQSDYTYDGSGNMMTELYRQWDGAGWMNVTLDSCTYDAGGNCLVLTDLIWDGAAWTYNIQETSTYDGNGKITSVLYEFWDGTAWSGSYRATYTNNGDGNRTSTVEQYWDWGAWVNSYKDTLMYDAGGNYIAYINWNSYDGMTWEEYSRGDFTYNSDGNMLTRINQMWNMGGWENYVKVEYAYPSGLITADAYTWTGTVWTSGDEYFSVVYNDDGNKIMFYTGASPAVQVLVYYSSVTAGIDPHAGDQSGSITAYPNPATDHMTIIAADPKVKIEKFQLFDLSGIEQQVTFTHHSVDLGNLPHGVYFLKMTTCDGQTVMKKIVKQ